MRQALEIIQTGQKAHLAAIDTHAHNINNANTQGHQRQKTDLVPLIVGGVGLGTKALPPHRVVDQDLTEKVFAHTSHVEYARTLSKAVSDFVIQFGRPGEGRDNLHSHLESFAKSLEVLQTATDGKSLRTSLDAAKGLASAINQMSEAIREQRENADLQIKTATERLSGQLDDLIQLNRLINYGVSRDNASAESERDRIIGEITKDLDVRVEFLDTNAVELFIGGAQRLLYPKAAFSFERTQPFDATKLHSSGQLSGVVVNGQDLTERIIASKKGKLAGLLHIRDEMMPKFQEQLDEFAAKLRDQTNAFHNEGTSFPPRDRLDGLRHIEDAGSAILTEGSGIVRFVLMCETQATDKKPQYLKQNVVELNLGELKKGGTVLGTTFTTAPTLQQLVNVLNGGNGGFDQRIFSIENNHLHLTAPTGHRLGIVSDEASPGVLSLTTGSTTTPCLGFSHLFGLNDFFVARHSDGRFNVAGDGTLAISDSFSVHPSIERQPEYQSRGRLRQKDGGLGETATIFDSTSDVSKDLANSIRKGSLLFQRAGDYPESRTTLFDYAADFISSIAQKASETQKALQQREIQLHSYEDASERLSAVDLMGELQALNQLHNNYLADLRVAEVIHSLGKATLDIIRPSY